MGVLRKPDVPAACAAIGIALPERFRSAGDIQDLHRAWTVAMALGLLAVDGSRATSEACACACSCSLCCASCLVRG